jgi:O-antigen ligase
MSRRGARTSNARRSAASTKPAGELQAEAPAPFDELESSLARLGENLRRLALGLLAALITARAYWPSEPDLKRGAGAGLVWVLAMLVTAGIALAAPLVGGRFRFRLSWTDVAVVTLMFLVGLSSTRGLDRRVAINLAWEWAGLGFAYVLTRNLPRNRGESTALAGALVATTVAVSVYGLYQGKVEIPELQARFLRNPQEILRQADLPADASQVRAFKDRLVGSNEIFSTFGLANSLAGFLVGPLVLALAATLQNLAPSEAKGSRWQVIARAALPLLCLLACLVLTKARSAYIGLLVGAVVVAWQARGRLSTKLLLCVVAAGLVVVVALAAAGFAAGRLDREVITQSTLSMRYRWEYWRGAWGVISEGAPTLAQALQATTFWSGVGPGNFGRHYLLYKLPEASEEIQDPHDLFLEVWATAGFWALLALVMALGLALRDLLSPVIQTPSTIHDPESVGSVPRETSKATRIEEAPAPTSPRWLAISAALGLVLVLLVGEMNFFEEGLFVRWLILGAGWLAAAFLGSGPWRRVPLPAPAFGAAALAVVVNLLAAGGIGFATVALGLWTLVALGLNLREDRPCGKLNEIDSRIPPFALAILWAALVGSFVGAVTPYWRAEAAIAQADEALRRMPPNYEGAQLAYDFAKQADRYSPRPWLGEAYLQYRVWQDHGSKPTDLRWKTIPTLLLKAASPPRNPNVWALHSERAMVTHDLLNKVGPSLSPRETIPIQAGIVEATRTASRLYPTNADLHARLAEASAAMSMFQDAVTEAREAIRLDGLTPHLNKKLPEAVRKRLEAKLPGWEEKAQQFKVELK